MYFKEDTVFYLDDIILDHWWQTIEDDINDKLYFKLYQTGTSNEWSIIAKISAGVYIGGDLAIELQTQMNSYTQTTTTTLNNVFKCEYVVKTNKMMISTLIDGYTFRIITQPELKTTLNNGFSTYYDTNKPNDMNDILSNLENASPQHNKVVPYLSGALNLQPFNNIYIHSTNLSNYNSIGPMNEKTIVKKVPVSADYNHMIFDQCVLINDDNDCCGQTIKTLYFKLMSSRGDAIPLHGCNWSFSIVFSRNSPDL